MNDGYDNWDRFFHGMMFLLTLVAICISWSSVEERLDMIEAQITCETEK